MVLLVGVALGAGAADTNLGVDLATLAARVEAEAGRRFDRLPTLRAAPAAAVEAELAQTYAVMRYLARLPQSIEGAHGKLDPDALALYEPARDTIWLLSDRLEAAALLEAVAPEDVGSVRRCTIAHELTHALQTRFVERRIGGPDADEAAIVEGQAALVAARVCRATEPPSGWRSFQVVTGHVGLLDYQDDDVDRAYRRGLIYVAGLQADGGREATWAALAAAAPSSAAVQAAVTARTGAPWRESARAVAWLSGLPHAEATLPVMTNWSRVATPSEDRRPPPAQQLGVYGCQAALTARGALHVELLWCKVEDGESWTPWADAWRAQSGRAAAVGVHVEVMPEPGVLLRVDDEASALESEWRGSGGAVAAISQSGPEKLRLKPKEREALFATALDESDAELDGLQALIDGEPPPPPPPLGALSVAYVGVPAVMAWVDGQPEACSDRVEALGGAGPLAALWMRCAVDAGDIARSDRAWAALAPQDREPDAVMAYVGLLENEQRWADARAVIEGIDAATAAGRAARAQLRVELDIQRQDLRALGVDGRDPALPDEVRLTAGQTLAWKGHFEDAHALVDEPCTRPANAPTCEEIRRIRGWK